jgi:hypothetical protein
MSTASGARLAQRWARSPCLSDYLKECGKIFRNELGRELIADVWHNADLHQWLLEEIGTEFGQEAVVGAMEHAVHVKPILGQIAGSYLGWRATTKKLDRALEFLCDAALEFHQRVFVPVAVARVLYVSAISLQAHR